MCLVISQHLSIIEKALMHYSYYLEWWLDFEDLGCPVCKESGMMPGQRWG